MGDIATPVQPIKGAMVAEYPEPSNHGTLQLSEKMPEFKGGVDALFQFVTDYFKPKKIIEKGSIYVRFVVNEDGKITSPEIINIPENLYYLKDEILKMVQKMPNWVSGENEGQKVKVYYTIPVRFE